MSDKKKDTVIVFNSFPPRIYGNFKIMCDMEGVDYYDNYTADFPTKVKGVLVFKQPVIKSKRIERK